LVVNLLTVFVFLTQGVVSDRTPRARRILPNHLLYAVHAPLPLVTITNFCQAIGHKHEEFARLERY
jgi:hypothetical protein